MPLCTKCNEDKSTQHFHRCGKNRNGTQRFKKHCNECQTKITQRIGSRNRQYAWRYFATHPCIDCGETDPRVLDFDHRDSTKKHDKISQMIWYASLDNLQKEISKCDIRCANCHRRRTADQFGFYKYMPL